MTPPRHNEDWWEAPPRPALLLGTGLVLGPHGLDVLRTTTLDLLSPIVPLGLAALVVLTVMKRKHIARLEMLVLAAAIVLVALVGDLADPSSIANRFWRAVEACGASALIGVAGLLLLRNEGPAARRVFILALLLLLAGIADFSGAPALATGAVAGTIWLGMSAQAVATITRDVEYLARPLATGLLLITGARLSISETTLLFAAVGALAVLVARRRVPMAEGTAGIFPLAVAIDITRGLDAGFAPAAHGAVVALCLIQAAEFIWGIDRAAVLAEGATE